MPCYKSFQKQQQNSRRFPVFPGVVDTVSEYRDGQLFHIWHKSVAYIKHWKYLFHLPDGRSSRSKWVDKGVSNWDCSGRLSAATVSRKMQEYCFPLIGLASENPGNCRWLVQLLCSAVDVTEKLGLSVWTSAGRRASASLTYLENTRGTKEVWLRSVLCLHHG